MAPPAFPTSPTLKAAFLLAFALHPVACGTLSLPALDVPVTAIDGIYDWNGIYLEWPDPSFGVDRWVIERAESPEGPWMVLFSGRVSPPDIRSGGRFRSARLVPHQTYYYRVAACTENGKTNYTTVVSGVSPSAMPGTRPLIATPTPAEPDC